MKAHKLVASIFGTGYLKGGGTYAAILTSLAWYGLQYKSEHNHFLLQALATIAITALGIWNGNVVEKDWGKDSSRVVIDEVSGQCVSLLAIPILSWQTVLAGLILFRVFDIWKPLGIRRMERLKGGWGVMLDDVAAGIYANILLQLVVYLKWIH